MLRRIPRLSLPPTLCRVAGTQRGRHGVAAADWRNPLESAQRPAPPPPSPAPPPANQAPRAATEALDGRCRSLQARSQSGDGCYGPGKTLGAGQGCDQPWPPRPGERIGAAPITSIDATSLSAPDVCDVSVRAGGLEAQQQKHVGDGRASLSRPPVLALCWCCRRLLRLTVQRAAAVRWLLPRREPADLHIRARQGWYISSSPSRISPSCIEQTASRCSLPSSLQPSIPWSCDIALRGHQVPFDSVSEAPLLRPPHVLLLERQPHDMSAVVHSHCAHTNPPTPHLVWPFSRRLLQQPLR